VTAFEAVAGAIGRSLFEAFSMFWATLWALVLGFALSGAVQAFVSRGRMQQLLGDHRPATVGKAGLLGMVSSSCSCAAAALAKTLFARGADFTSSMVFMFASTNLVIELGAVLWLLLGRPFALAELVGGVIMIVLLALVVPRVLPGRWIDDARARLEQDTGDDSREGSGAGEVVETVETVETAMPVMSGLSWDYTTWLNTVAVAGFTSSIGSTAPGTATAAARATPRTRSAGCRSKPRMPPRALSSTTSATTSAPMAAAKRSGPSPDATAPSARPRFPAANDIIRAAGVATVPRAPVVTFPPLARSPGANRQAGRVRAGRVGVADDWHGRSRRQHK